MTSVDVELVCDVRNQVGESPIWNSESSTLYWVDIPLGKIYSWSWHHGSVRAWQLPEMVGCIAKADNGDVIAAMETGIFQVTLDDNESASVRKITGVTHVESSMRFNDGRSDRQGRFWAGTMNVNMAANSSSGVMYQFDGARLKEHCRGYMVPNGLAFSPDGKFMYLSDSHPTRQFIWRFDYDIADGVPSSPRLWVDMRQHPGRPDGAAIDTDGCYWICGNDAGLVHRFTPDGRLDRSIPVPVKKPAMCTFGGPSLDTLFVTSIRTPHGLNFADDPLSGNVFALKPGISGILDCAVKI